MGSALLTFLVIAIFIAARSLRRSRRQWVRQLRLPGGWICEFEGVSYHLELKGTSSEGEFRETWRIEGEPHELKGAWRLVGSRLQFTHADGVIDNCELRQFDATSIALHGSERQHRVYQRTADNVVALGSRGRNGAK